MQNKSLHIFLFSLFAFPCVTSAGIIALPNQSPIVAIFGVPSPVDFEEPENKLSVDLNIANNFVPRKTDDETLALDGETSRLVTHYQRQLSECWMFGVEIPVVNHAGGALDSFVDNWHQWFDLPESGRPQVDRDRLHYSYSVDGEVVLLYRERAIGVGDSSLMLTQRQHCGMGSGKILRFGVKLPTGDPDSLFGSGAADAFVDLSQQIESIYRSVDFSYTAGLLLAGKSQVIPQHYSYLVYGAVSFELPLSQRISLDAQLAVQSPTIRSDLRVLSDWPVQLLVGVSLQASSSTVWNVALSEDPEYGTSSDVVFQFGFRSSY